MCAFGKRWYEKWRNYSKRKIQGQTPCFPVILCVCFLCYVISYQRSCVDSKLRYRIFEFLCNNALQNSLLAHMSFLDYQSVLDEKL